MSDREYQNYLQEELHRTKQQTGDDWGPYSTILFFVVLIMWAWFLASIFEPGV